MKTKTDIKKEIENIFTNGILSSETVKKTIKLANRNRIRLGKYRETFCKKCLSNFYKAKVRVTKNHKTLTCESCGYKNKIKIS